jgi:YHS domain-containing protein
MCQHHHHEPETHERAEQEHVHHEHGHHHHHETAPAATAESDELAQCPVMPGSMAVKADAEAAGLVRQHQGRTYWLCCAACGPLFDADPERYTAA